MISSRLHNFFIRYAVIQKLFVICILLLASFFRYINLDWDQGQHLHPDERFLTMVVNKIQLPHSFNEYLNPAISPINPTNNGFDFFVYGISPLVLAKFIAVWTSNDTYASFTTLGRFLSATCDLIAVFVIYKLVQLFEDRDQIHAHIKYYAMLFYAIAVLPIQLSHFYATDTFLNTFILLSVYFMLRFYYRSSYISIGLSGIFYGLAFSAKVSAIYSAPLIGVIFLISLFQNSKRNFKKKRALPISFSILFMVSLFIVCSYIALRLGNPYMFASASILNIKINPTFYRNLSELKSWEGYDTWFPPAIQWINKPAVLFSLVNLTVFGVGIPYFLYSIIGIIWVLIYKRKTILTVITFWVVGFFLYQSVQFVKVMRYFITIYPFIAVFAALGLHWLIHKRHLLLIILMISLTLFWPLSFISIYMHPHSRVAASSWIYKNLPNNSMLLSEYWDDALPLPMIQNFPKKFTIEQLHVFDQDTPEKWLEMDRLLNQANYYILSSNRGWGSIPTVPQKYPRMTQFYENLFAGKTNYKKIQEFTSYPSFSIFNFQLPIPDDWSDESFTVYDHPHVMIFKNIYK